VDRLRSTGRRRTPMGRWINVGIQHPLQCCTGRLKFGQADRPTDRTTYTRTLRRRPLATRCGFGGRFGSKSICFIRLGRLQDDRTLDGREGHENYIRAWSGKLIVDRCIAYCTITSLWSPGCSIWTLR
jgi:hypothetical protein